MIGHPKLLPNGQGRTYQLGRLTLTVKVTAEDNASAYTLRGVPHSVKNVGSAFGRELVISSPGGIFDAFIAEAAAAIANPAAATLGAGSDFRTIAAKYGIEFLAS